jgi:hypothetical protein
VTTENYKIAVAEDTIGQHEFYTKHLSKSLPLHVKNGAVSMDIKQ